MPNTTSNSDIAKQAGTSIDNVMECVPVKAVQSLLTSINPGHKIYVGFSGGADSTALLLALQQCHANVIAVHFNHGIRGNEADEDEKWCQAFCEQRQINFISYQLHVPENTRRGESCEEAARRLRLEHWNMLADNNCVFLAHHADDALEELFLRLARGSNTSALVPMKASRTIGNVTYYRPFLHLRKKQLEDWLSSKGITDWRIDSTNSQNEYRRNAVRNKLLPLFREIFDNDSGLLLALDALRQDAALIDDLANRYENREPSIEDWCNMPLPVLARVIRPWLQRQGIFANVTRPFILNLHSALERYSGRQRYVQLDAQSVIIVSSTGLSIRQNTDKSWSYSWHWAKADILKIQETGFTLRADISGKKLTLICHDNLGNECKESFNSEAMPDILEIRPWQAGDRMIPFGSKSPKKLQDLFSDAKIPRHSRESYPLILANNAIIWLPFVRRAEFGRLVNANQKTDEK